ncbi:hypothetical protein NQ317_008623 [Molorchus minor]|uniref:Uncharacterized protein n=1 Tax=Molorchus minor TaxID=1323400 RepID=A0ABQ9J5R6_9CUCU|nr:hypothetical protein NQ317_008623 [Molorchus minor]
MAIRPYSRAPSWCRRHGKSCYGSHIEWWAIQEDVAEERRELSPPYQRLPKEVPSDLRRGEVGKI